MTALAPSAARTAKWTVATSGNSAPFSFGAKYPIDKLDYSIDLSAFVKDATDTVISITPVPTPSDLTIAPLPQAGNVLTCLISGGMGGQTYFIDYDIVTLAGREMNMRVALSVLIGPVASTTPAYLTNDSGVVLTNDSNTPFTQG